jgi:hypothetical protein
MSLAEIRNKHRVPAKRGGQILAKDPNGQLTYGTIKAGTKGFLVVQLVGHDDLGLYHPDEVEYCEKLRSD